VRIASYLPRRAREVSAPRRAIRHTGALPDARTQPREHQHM